jgi:hypothetical protein
METLLHLIQSPPVEVGVLTRSGNIEIKENEKHEESYFFSFNFSSMCGRG